MAKCIFCEGLGHYEGGGGMWCDCPAGQAARHRARSDAPLSTKPPIVADPCPFYGAALETMEGSTPGLSQPMRESIARSIGLKVRNVLVAQNREAA